VINKEQTGVIPNFHSGMTPVFLSIRRMPPRLVSIKGLPQHLGESFLFDRSRFGSQNGFNLIKTGLQHVINGVKSRSNNKSDTLDSGES
jgi:hypothetical protein